MTSDEERRIKAVELAISTRGTDGRAIEANLLLAKAEQIDAFLRKANVTEGLFVTLTGTQLKLHLEQRAEHHYQRAATYRSQADRLEFEQDAADQNLSNNPVQSLHQSQNRHQARHDYFVFMADHVVTDATYRLSEQDLTRLELLGQNL